MDAKVKKAKTTRGKAAGTKRGPTQYKLRDGRPVTMVPWMAQTPVPWKPGYARVFIPFTAAEMRSARHNGPRGHEQIVNIRRLVKA